MKMENEDLRLLSSEERRKYYFKKIIDTMLSYIIDIPLQVILNLQEKHISLN